ncbi:MAG TPA: 16S rRNA (uracil(1498)-N(3))-methyltransferase [Gammaproteobacteria bacterium]|nr:16S rRNA (uracil(1498)-N(3))-methyltransferase [Gammaproteobacteria bacterium]
MRNTRIYTNQPLASNTLLHLEQGSARHIVRVLRMHKGDQITLFNGMGGEYIAKVTQLDKSSVILKIGDFCDQSVESSLNIELVQAISRGERMDITIQKAVELGVNKIQPLFTSRCNVKLSGDRLIKKLTHWQKIAVSACEQCGRNRVPEVCHPLDIIQWTERSDGSSNGVLLNPVSGKSCRDMPAMDNISLLVGPEGGLTDTEISAAATCGFTSVRLGPRILRTETAALAMIATVQALWGDFG